MTPQTQRLTPLVKVPVFLLRDRDQELSEAYDEIERLKAEIAVLKGKDWSVRDSVTY